MKVNRLFFLFSFCFTLLLVFAFSSPPKLSLLKIQLKNYKGDTTKICDCNIESRYTIITARIWLSKEMLYYDKLNFDLVKPGVLKYVRERDGQSYFSFTKNELKELMKGKDYIDIEFSYYAYCDYKATNLCVMIFGDVITGYTHEEVNNKRIRVPVFVGGNGKPLGISAEFKTSAKL